MTFEVGLSRLPNVFGINVDGTKERRSPLARWLIGIAATGLGLGGCFLFVTQSRGTHITRCGFDADGAYAKVRVNHVLNWPDTQEVWVDFYLDGKEFTYAGRYDFPVPALGDGTGVVRGGFPRADDHVSGRTVYVDATHHGQFPRFVTRRFAEANPHTTSKEVVPDASHTLSCSMDYTDPD
jgi:hypothetical protein